MKNVTKEPNHAMRFIGHELSLLKRDLLFCFIVNDLINNHFKKAEIWLWRDDHNGVNI